MNGRSPVILIVAAVIVINLLIPQSINAKKNTSNNCVMFQQYHHMYGPLNVYVDSRKLTVEAGQNDFVLTAHAPQWQVNLYSPGKKKVYNQSYKSWMRKGMSSLSILGMTDQTKRKLKKTGFAKYKSIDVIRYKLVVNNNQYLVYKGSSNLAIPGQILCQLLNTPMVSGIPVLYKRHEEINESKNRLTYYAGAHKPVALDTVLVSLNSKPPAVSNLSGFVLVDSDRPIIVGAGKKEFLENLFGSWNDAKSKSKSK